LVIFANQRIAYLDSLRAADLGDFRPVLSFFRDRGIDTMQLVAESLQTPDMRERPSETEIENLQLRLKDAVDQQFRSRPGQAPEINILFSPDAGNPFPFVVRVPESPDQLEIRLEDLHPELSASLKLRLAQWVERRLEQSRA
jgi:uncharacterized membrane protein